MLDKVYRVTSHEFRAFFKLFNYYGVSLMMPIAMSAWFAFKKNQPNSCESWRLSTVDYVAMSSLTTVELLQIMGTVFRIYDKFSSISSAIDVIRGSTQNQNHETQVQLLAITQEAVEKSKAYKKDVERLFLAGTVGLLAGTLAYIFIKIFAINNSELKYENGIADFIYFILQTVGYPVLTNLLESALKKATDQDDTASNQQDLINRREHPASAPMVVQRAPAAPQPAVTLGSSANLAQGQNSQHQDSSQQVPGSASTVTQAGMFRPQSLGSSTVPVQDQQNQDENDTENNIDLVESFSFNSSGS